VGHVPYQVTPAECSAAGQKSIEHVFGIEMPYTAGYVAWRRALRDAKNPANVPVLELPTRVETFSLSDAAALFPVLRKNHTWLCPTLTASRGLGGDQSLIQDPRLKYIGRNLNGAWAAGLKDLDLPLVRRAHDKYLEIVGAMHKAGVGILAGTDTLSAPYCLPGFGLHDELQLLVRAGLTPMDALRAATYNPAEFLGKLDSLGTVERGKLAELVLLDANPLNDIANTQKINTVITGGRVYRKPALEAMLNAVEVDARNSYFAPKSPLSAK
jgi:hypothetical protein